MSGRLLQATVESRIQKRVCIEWRAVLQQLLHHERVIHEVEQPAFRSCKEEF